MEHIVSETYTEATHSILIEVCPNWVKSKCACEHVKYELPSPALDGATEVVLAALVEPHPSHTWGIEPPEGVPFTDYLESMRRESLLLAAPVDRLPQTLSDELIKKLSEVVS